MLTQKRFPDSGSKKAAGSIAERRIIRHNLHRRVMRIVGRYKDHEMLGRYMTTLENASPDLFRYALDPRIPSTNNPGERSLRELVVHRKIRGCLGAAGTMQWMADIFTCTETWKAHGQDIRAQLAKYV